MAIRFFFILTGFILCIKGSTQTLGGNAVYNFLKLPATPLLTATGGVNASYKTGEVGFSSNNPSLLNESLHSQMNVSFNSFLGGIKTYALTGAYHYNKYKTTFGGQLYFVDYGSLPQTDAAGNVMGEFRPVDFVFQLSAGKQYTDKISYGASLKFINSNYGQYRSSAIALDAGVHFSDTSKGFSAGLLIKNMGTQLKTYAGEGEDLPFDLQVGITKKLAKAPLGFSLTAQHLQRFDIFYNDTLFNNENSLTSNNNFINKLMNHLVVATHIYAGSHLEATIGYNRLRRSELNIGTSGNGLNGFSLGLRVMFQKLQVLFARSSYQKNVTYNQLGITIHLNRLLGKEL